MITERITGQARHGWWQDLIWFTINSDFWFRLVPVHTSHCTKIWPELTLWYFGSWQRQDNWATGCVLCLGVTLTKTRRNRPSVLRNTGIISSSHTWQDQERYGGNFVKIRIYDHLLFMVCESDSDQDQVEISLIAKSAPKSPMYALYAQRIPSARCSEAVS